MKKALYLLLLAATIGHAQERVEILNEGNVTGVIDNYVTNLPTTISIKNGVLSFDNAGTNIWTSSEAHDWGSWLPNGAPNPFTDAVAVNKPLLLQPVGTQWATAGGFAVLALSPGVSMSALGSDASVTWTFPDGSSWKWIAESQVDVPATASGISLAVVDGVEVVQIDYAVSADAGALALMRSATYAGTYSDVTNVVWTQISETTRRATIPTDGATRGFFRARVADTIPAHIEASCPVHFSGGVMIGQEDYNPVLYNATVEITANDGKRYRIPAQAME